MGATFLEEEKRKLKELASVEAEAVKRARTAARRPLNSFEERRVRRQAMTKTLSGWWFGTFYLFPYIGNNDPN